MQQIWVVLEFGGMRAAWKFIYDAVIRVKLVYRLATAALTQSEMAMVGASQLRGLRQILKLRHPYVERATTNARVMEFANSGRCPRGGRILTFSEYYKAHRLTLFAHVLGPLPEDPIRRVTFLGGVARRCLVEQTLCGQAAHELDHREVFAGVAGSARPHGALRLGPT